jgi:hypothetical protein
VHLFVHYTYSNTLNGTKVTIRLKQKNNSLLSMTEILAMCANKTRPSSLNRQSYRCFYPRQRRSVIYLCLAETCTLVHTIPRKRVITGRKRAVINTLNYKNTLTRSTRQNHTRRREFKWVISRKSGRPKQDNRNFCPLESGNDLNNIYKVVSYYTADTEHQIWSLFGYCTFITATTVYSVNSLTVWAVHPTPVLTLNPLNQVA